MKAEDREEEALKVLLEAATAEDVSTRPSAAMRALFDRYRGESRESVPKRRNRKTDVVALLLFDDVVALDAVGPYEALCRLSGVEIVAVARRPGPVRAARGGLGLIAARSLEEVPRPDILVVPGGPGTDAVNRDEATLAWIRSVHETTRWTASVCTGSLVLAAAGLLDGVRATTHWAAIDRLRGLGAEIVPERVVREGKILTSAGVSAGIDLGLALVALIGGDELAQCVQLGMEYDPRPPFDSGSPEKAPPRVLERVRRAMAAERGLHRIVKGS